MLKTFFIAILLAVSLAPAALAQSPADEIVPCITGCGDVAPTVQDLPVSDLQDEFLPLVARTLTFGMAFVAFAVLSYAGYLLVTSWGKDDEMDKAKKMIQWGVFGIFVAAAAFTAVRAALNINFDGAREPAAIEENAAG